ncbi:hypothetical protein ALC62_05835 [Cyphomyrmex costatus]|uniref:Uncharacterized protein n=1 Tax=Cyphomyrmex costatus TaxID=456900 RepID=A0A151IJG8_9HYME|nr:hypothetical protein ALC62_05835 [Cyphomyrmex costatus]
MEKACEVRRMRLQPISLSELPRRLEVERGKIDTYTKQLDICEAVDGAMCTGRAKENGNTLQTSSFATADRGLFLPLGSSSRTTEGVDQEREGFLLG